MEYTIRHNSPESRFELTVDNHMAVVEYKLYDNKIYFNHTKVPSALEGHGIGSILVKYGLDYALKNELEIVAVCPFVKSYITKHSEYQQ